MDIPQQSIYVESPRLEVGPFIPPDSRSALDVGCGRGGFARTLREALGPGARIVGIDAVEVNVDCARSDRGFDEVIHGYFPDALSGSGERFDLLTFLDVLEHMLDPWTALEATREHLVPGGHVLATIPSVRVWSVVAQLLKGRWDYQEQGSLDRTHVRFFTKQTMIDMFHGCGYEVERCEGINSTIRMWPPRRIINRALVTDLRFLPLLVPEMRWLQFVVLGRIR